MEYTWSNSYLTSVISVAVLSCSAMIKFPSPGILISGWASITSIVVRLRRMAITLAF